MIDGLAGKAGRETRTMTAFPKHTTPANQDPVGDFEVRILLAEHELPLLEALGDSLEADGCCVVRCQDNESLLEHLADHLLPSVPVRFDLVICDAHLPKAHPLELLAEDGDRHLLPPVMLMNGHPDRDLPRHVRATGLGVVAFLDGPPEVDEVRLATWEWEADGVRPALAPRRGHA